MTFIAYITYNDPDTELPVNAQTDISFAMVQTGENARSCWIAGEQVFKYDPSGDVAPAQITLSANLQHVAVEKWSYRDDGGAWRDYPTTADNATITGTTLIVKPSHAIWVGDMATLRLSTNDTEIGDVITIYKVRDGLDGAAGASAPVAFLTNESIQFAANASGQTPLTTRNCNVAAYLGATKVTPSIGTIAGAPAGMTVSVGSESDHEIPLTISVVQNATLGGAGQQQGVLDVPITYPVATTLQINWSKLNAGSQGASGADAVVFSLYAPEGAVFVNQEGALVIQVAAYHGSTPIASGATYAWSQYKNGAWQALAEASDSLLVNGADVPGTATFRCQMTFEGRIYTDVITLTDKSDNIQAVIDSTAGNVFKNAAGETVLICRLWQNNAEVDSLRTVKFGLTAPTDPAVGSFYYKASLLSPTMRLM